MEELLTPLLYQALTPVAEAMARLDSRQQETRQVLQALVEMPRQQDPETKELLLEILNSLQPPAEQEIVQLVGRRTPPRSSPSSAR